MPEKTRNWKLCPTCKRREIRTRSKQCASCAKVGHTPEQRDAHALCGAKKKNGSTCRAFAGQGTNPPGYGHCKFHGGNSPGGEQHAAKIEAMAWIREAAPEIDMTPGEALTWCIRLAAGQVAFLNERMTGPELPPGQALMLREMYGVERDRLARVSKAAVDAGVEIARVEMEAHFAEQLVKAVIGASREIGLTDKHNRALGIAVSARLRGGSSQDDEERLRQLREEIEADDQRRIEQRAKEWTGLTFPPEEMVIEGTAREPGT